MLLVSKFKLASVIMLDGIDSGNTRYFLNTSEAHDTKLRLQ